MRVINEQPLVQIVDDDQAMRMLMRASLEQAGYQVAESDNGRDAVEKFAQLHPDAVLLDVMMPEMDGFETCSALRQLPGGEHTPVLMVTGLEDIESIHKAFEVGATDFVTKPINWVMLGYRVHYMLRASQAFLDLHDSQSQLAEAQHLAKLGNWEFNPQSGRLWGSPEFFKILSLEKPPQPAALDTLLQAVHPADREQLEIAVQDAMSDMGAFHLDTRVELPDGSGRVIYHQGEAIYDSRQKQKIVRGIIQDVTDLRKAEEQIRYLAYFDGLTGLANRELFNDRLEKALAAGLRRQRTMALLFLDLDRFKLINDSLGHHIGDQLLIETANRISSSVRDADSVARINPDESTFCVSRLGGDEFTVLLTDLGRPEEAAIAAKRIIASVCQPLVLEGNEIVVTTSVGISVFPFDGQDAETLMKNADTAMYEAKQLGRNNYQFFKEALNLSTSNRFGLEKDLRKALEREELCLWYQPQYRLATGEVIGAEALLRWEHPERGMVSPAEFIPIAEETGLIIPITEWVLSNACRQASKWQSLDRPPLQVAVNISGQNFAQQNLEQLVTEALKSSGLAAELLELELTESVLMENKRVVRQVLEQLNSLGVNTAIDDFGTGYSSLSYLQSFPIQTLKIDRSFIARISDNPSDTAIIRAIVAMAQSLELAVIAEGIETEAQQSFLKEQGCEHGQGFLFSRPLPAAEFTELLLSDAPRQNMLARG